MRELGDLLRRAREEKGTAIEEIQKRTKIRRCYLEALEEGDLRIIPGEIYRRGFLRNYAEAVGLEPRRVLELYDRLRAAAAVPPPPPGETAASAPAGEEEGKTGRRGAPWRQAAVMLGSLIVFSALLLLALRTREAAPARKPAAEARSLALQARPPEKRRPAEEGLRLVLTYTGRCWVALECDGRPSFEGTVEPGTIQEWKARTRITARFGNAGAVRAELNGEALPPFGAPGQTVSKEFRYTQ